MWKVKTMAGVLGRNCLIPLTEVLKLLFDPVKFSYNIKMIDKPSICSDWPSPLTLELHSGKNTFIVNLNQRINYV